MSTEFNGEIKQYRDAALALREFEQTHPDLISQLESLQGAVEATTELVKAKAKRILTEGQNDPAVVKSFDDGRISQGVKVWARRLFTDKFDLSPAAVKIEDLARLHNAKSLTVDAKAYKTARENGDVPADLDQLIRKEVVKQTNSGVELVIE